MTEYRIELFFNEDVFPETVKKVHEELIKLKAYRINTTDFIMMRNKLIYIPVIMATAVYGPPKIEYDKLTWGSFAWNLYTESESHFTTAFAWHWSDEDQQAYEMLSSRVRVRIEPIRWESVPKKHALWPVTVFDLKEVREEVERMRRGALLLPDDLHDRQLINVFKKRVYLGECEKMLEEKGMDEMIKCIMMREDRFMREKMLKLHDTLMKARDEVESVFWFSFYYPG